jgi:hypothetical protein
MESCRNLPSQPSLPCNFECFCQRREATSNKNLRRKLDFPNTKTNIKFHTKKRHKPVHKKTKLLRRIHIGSLKPVKMVACSVFGLIQQSSLKRVIQNSNHTIRRTEFQLFQAYGANMKILSTLHRTEFAFPTHLCPPNFITKCVHKNNFLTLNSLYNNTTGQKWDLKHASRLFAIFKATYWTP